MIDRLLCEVREYAWGDEQAIPKLRNRPVTGNPRAELWMGAHHGAPSTLASSGVALNDAIAADPIAMLGSATVEEFGQLPFLFKVLAAKLPLSIQVHPTKAQAEIGFERENQAGIGLEDPLRTYRDDNHKPELVVALEPFEALCGFRSVAQTQEILVSIEVRELLPLLEVLGTSSETPRSEQRVIEDSVRYLLGLDPETLRAMVEAVVACGSSLPLSLRWVGSVAAVYPADAGVLVGLLMNYVVLEPGDGVFLDAGNVHAYLSGVAVELMANSDNVVRAGLTPKHKDVDELVSIASFAPIDPPVQRPAMKAHDYESSVGEFALARVVPTSESVEVASVGPEIMLVEHGSVTLRSSLGDEVILSQGEVGFVSADEGSYCVSGTGLAWRATIGT